MYSTRRTYPFLSPTAIRGFEAWTASAVTAFLVASRWVNSRGLLLRSRRRRVEEEEGARKASGVRGETARAEREGEGRGRSARTERVSRSKTRREGGEERTARRVWWEGRVARERTREGVGRKERRACVVRSISTIPEVEVGGEGV